MKIVRGEEKIPFEAKDGSEIRELLKSESERMSLCAPPYSDEDTYSYGINMIKEGINIIKE